MIKIAWAPGQAMKDKEWKDYWEIEDGVSYIPWEKLNKEIDYDELEGISRTAGIGCVCPSIT